MIFHQKPKKKHFYRLENPSKLPFFFPPRFQTIMDKSLGTLAFLGHFPIHISPTPPPHPTNNIGRNIQLFQERLSEKVHATIAKGIVGGFEFTFLQRNLKELAQKAMKMCLRVLTESNKSKFKSYSHQEQCIDHIPYYLSGLSRAHFFRQPFSK